MSSRSPQRESFEDLFESPGEAHGSASASTRSVGTGTAAIPMQVNRSALLAAFEAVTASRANVQPQEQRTASPPTSANVISEDDFVRVLRLVRERSALANRLALARRIYSQMNPSAGDANAQQIRQQQSPVEAWGDGPESAPRMRRIPPELAPFRPWWMDAQQQPNRALEQSLLADSPTSPGRELISESQENREGIEKDRESGVENALYACRNGCCTALRRVCGGRLISRVELLRDRGLDADGEKTEASLPPETISGPLTLHDLLQLKEGSQRSKRFGVPREAGR